MGPKYPPTLHINKVEVPNCLRYAPNSPEGKKSGKQLAGGYWATLWSVVGDLEYFASHLDVPRSTLAAGPCSRCQATKWGERTWQDYRPTANWLSTVFTPAGWRALPAAAKSSCPLFHMRATSICNLGYDYMHCKYLGVDKNTYSAVLYLLVFHVLSFGSPQANLDWLWAEIQRHYKNLRLPSQFRYLNRISMFYRERNNSLGLRGKAAEIRSLAEPLLLVWADKMTAAIESHRKIHLLLKLNLRLEQLLVDNKFESTFSDANAAVFRDAMNGFCLIQEQLSQHFCDNSPRMFNLTEKSHFLQHLALEAHCLNPRLIWCFAGEDAQRRVQRLSAACVKGQRPGQAEVKMCHRYRLALHLQFCKHGR